MYERALEHGMVEEGIDPVYSIISIQQLLDESHGDHAIIEELIIGRDSIFGLSRRYLYLLEKGSLLRFPAGQVSLKGYETIGTGEESLEIVLGDDSRFLSLSAVVPRRWPEVFKSREHLAQDSEEQKEKSPSRTDNHGYLPPDTSSIERDGSRSADLSGKPKNENTTSLSVQGPKKKRIYPILISVIIVIILAGGGLYFLFSSASSEDQKTDSSLTETVQDYDRQTVEDLSEVVLPRTEAYQGLIDKIQDGSGVTDAEIFKEQSSLLETIEEIEAYGKSDNLLVNSAEDYLRLMYENMTAFADAIKASGTTSQILYQSALSNVSQVEEARDSFYMLLNKARTELDLDEL